jgi:hypothetical protein
MYSVLELFVPTAHFLERDACKLSLALSGPYQYCANALFLVPRECGLFLADMIEQRDISVLPVYL